MLHSRIFGSLDFLRNFAVQLLDCATVDDYVNLLMPTRQFRGERTLIMGLEALEIQMRTDTIGARSRT